MKKYNSIVWFLSLRTLYAKDTRIKCQLQLQNSKDLENTVVQQSNCQKVAKILSFKQVKIKLKFQKMSKHLAHALLSL